MPTPKKIVVTDEMRQAVMAEMCERDGHAPSFDQMLNNKTAGRDVGGSEGKLPHIYCNRCSRVWLVVPDPGSSYEDAVSKLRGRLKDGDPLRNRLSDTPKK